VKLRLPLYKKIKMYDVCNNGTEENILLQNMYRNRTLDRTT